MAFGLFSGDKGDNSDMWMIKITVKANQIDMDVLFISKVDNIQKPCLSLKSGFFIISLVCEFCPHGQTWYQKFIGSYTPLNVGKRDPLQVAEVVVHVTISNCKLAIVSKQSMQLCKEGILIVVTHLQLV